MTDKHCKLKGEHYDKNCTRTYMHTYVCFRWPSYTDWTDRMDSAKPLIMHFHVVYNYYGIFLLIELRLLE